ncbi:MAG: hypothetical protein PHO63_05830 [Bacilli bacterium]|nr:hypothetical protein [Bacilli bacterium]MDD4808726.1 hypothetical protein [Bacilli bacterium]
MKKLLMVCSLFVLLVGCGNKELDQAYEKMQIDSKEMNGYSLDLRIYGTLDNLNINEIVKIDNHQNKDFEIKYFNQTGEETIYIKDNKVYTLKDGIYIETNQPVKYDNPNIYLEGLKDIKKSEKSIKKDGYDVYEVTVSKDTVAKIIEDAELNIKVTKDVKAEISLDDEGYVYRIIYNIDDIVINACYYGINNSKEIRVPIADEIIIKEELNN